MPTIALSNFALGMEDEPLRGLEFAVQHGFHGLEFGTSELSPEYIDRAGRKRFRSLAEANGVALSIHFLHRDMAPASHDPVRRAVSANGVVSSTVSSNATGFMVGCSRLGSPPGPRSRPQIAAKPGHRPGGCWPMWSSPGRHGSGAGPAG